LQRENKMKHKATKLVYSTDPKIRQQIDSDKKLVKKDQLINLPPEKQSLKISVQTKGRRGKNVTIIQGFKHDPEILAQLARELKQFCGVGGTVKGQDIEIQGDKRKQLAEKLRHKGYHVSGY